MLSDLACRTGARRARAARRGAVLGWIGVGNGSGEDEERAGSGCLSYVPLDGGAWMLSDVELLFLLVDRLKPRRRKALGPTPSEAFHISGIIRQTWIVP